MARALRDEHGDNAAIAPPQPARVLLETARNGGEGGSQLAAACAPSLLKLGMSFIDGARVPFASCSPVSGPATGVKARSALGRRVEATVKQRAQRQCVELGIELLTALFAHHDGSRATIVEQLMGRVIISASSTPSFVRLLASIAQSHPEHMTTPALLPRIKEAIEYLSYLPAAHAIAVLTAVAPMLQMKSSSGGSGGGSGSGGLVAFNSAALAVQVNAFRDFLALVLRKALFRQEASARVIGASGILLLLRVSSTAESADDGLFEDMLATLQRCLSQQPEVRAVVYTGLAALVDSRLTTADAKARVAAVLSAQLAPLCPAAVPGGRSSAMPLTLARCVDATTGEVTEPLPLLISCMRHCSAAAATTTTDDENVPPAATSTTSSSSSSSALAVAGSGGASACAQQLASLRQRLSACRPEDWALDRSTDFSTDTVAGKRNCALSAMLIAVHEVLMESVLTAGAGAGAGASAADGGGDGGGGGGVATTTTPDRAAFDEALHLFQLRRELMRAAGGGGDALLAKKSSSSSSSSSSSKGKKGKGKGKKKKTDEEGGSKKRKKVSGGGGGAKTKKKGGSKAAGGHWYTVLPDLELDSSLHQHCFTTSLVGFDIPILRLLNDDQADEVIDEEEDGVCELEEFVLRNVRAKLNNDRQSCGAESLHELASLLLTEFERQQGLAEKAEEGAAKARLQLSALALDAVGDCIDAAAADGTGVVSLVQAAFLPFLPEDAEQRRKFDRDPLHEASFILGRFFKAFVSTKGKKNRGVALAAMNLAEKLILLRAKADESSDEEEDDDDLIAARYQEHAEWLTNVCAETKLSDAALATAAIRLYVRTHSSLSFLSMISILLSLLDIHLLLYFYHFKDATRRTSFKKRRRRCEIIIAAPRARQDPPQSKAGEEQRRRR